MPTEGFEIAARVQRGPGIEALHGAAIAVVDQDSRLCFALGDPSQVFFTRSSIKPLQALALVSSEARSALGLSDEELALCCASHNGSDRHREIVLGILGKCGLDAGALRCGTHWPIGDRLAKKYPLHGEDQDPLRHNCSGKHAGFLALSRHLGQPTDAYLEPQGVVQGLVREAAASACEMEPSRLEVAIDGCSAPNFAMPLSQLAVGFKNLALLPQFSEVRTAMLAHPWLISGDKRLDYDLARSFPGNVVNKGGAEAIVALGFRDPPLGITIKVIDGSDRALGPIVVEALKQLGRIDDLANFPELVRHEQPPVINFRKIRTGEIVPSFRLRKL